MVYEAHNNSYGERVQVKGRRQRETLALISRLLVRVMAVEFRGYSFDENVAVASAPASSSNLTHSAQVRGDNTHVISGVILSCEMDMWK